VRSRPTISVPTGADGAACRPRPASVGRRHVDLARLAGEVLAEFVNDHAQPEERDRGYDEEEQDRRLVVSSQGRVHTDRRREEATGDVEPIRQGNRAADRLAPIREDGEGEEDAAEDVEQPRDALREAMSMLRGETRNPTQTDADRQEDGEAQDRGNEDPR